MYRRATDQIITQLILAQQIAIICSHTCEQYCGKQHPRLAGLAKEKLNVCKVLSCSFQVSWKSRMETKEIRFVWKEGWSRPCGNAVKGRGHATSCEGTVLKREVVNPVWAGYPTLYCVPSFRKGCPLAHVWWEIKMIDWSLRSGRGISAEQAIPDFLY